jgi:hypothetical protein
MGLDAFVCCNGIKQRIAPPHPFPELLAFDETAEPILKSDHEISLDQWLKHDAWYKRSCPHSGRLVEKRLGNVALATHVRALLDSMDASRFPLMQDRVLHSETHGGDWILAADSGRLLEEARSLQRQTRDSVALEFASDVIEVCEASVATGNPIVF